MGEITCSLGGFQEVPGEDGWAENKEGQLLSEAFWMLRDYNSQHPSARALLAGADENCSPAMPETQRLIMEMMRETDRAQPLFWTGSISLLWQQPAEIPTAPSLSASCWRHPDVPPTASSSSEVEQPAVLSWEQKKKGEITQLTSEDLSSNSAFSYPDGQDPFCGGRAHDWTKLPQRGPKQAGRNRGN